MSGTKQDSVWLYFDRKQIVGYCARKVAKRCSDLSPDLNKTSMIFFYIMIFSNPGDIIFQEL